MCARAGAWCHPPSWMSQARHHSPCPRQAPVGRGAEGSWLCCWGSGCQGLGWGMQSAGTEGGSPEKWCLPCQQAALLPPLLLPLLPLSSCLLTGALLSLRSIPGRCHSQPLSPPCASLMKTFSTAAAASGPCSSSLLYCAPSSLWDLCAPPFGDKEPSTSSWHPHDGQGSSLPGHPDPPAPQPGARRPLPAQAWALLCMHGAAFGVMKYLQVSGFVRNDRDQSIPFQGVIFFPFVACVPC